MHRSITRCASTSGEATAGSPSSSTPLPLAAWRKRFCRRSSTTRSGLFSTASQPVRSHRMAKKTGVDDRTVSKDELKQIDRANSSGKQPVVFVHGLWLLPSSWDRWAKKFETAGFTALFPGWPDDPDTVAEANAHPEVLAHKTVGQVADHFDPVVRALKMKPTIICHCLRRLVA